jgi:energy-coupling factor transporter ATP-binding protein EcfA2
MPTIYPKNWDSAVVNKYITQESQQKSREEFEKTHVPINRIRVEENKVFDTWTDEDESLVSEDIVLDTVSRSTKDDSNRLFFVVGESGSGKSELCQWLDYQIQDEADSAEEGEFAHEPILVPRHVREPREVVEVLTENLDGWDFEDAKYLRDLPMEGIYREVTGKILNRFKESQQATIDFLKDDAFESKVRSNLETYVDAFDDPDASISFEPIEQDELATLLEKFPGAAREHEHHEVDPAEYLYREIKTGATEAVSDMLSAGDIQQILRDIDKAYESRNRRPVLIIEDLTGFTVYDHQVLSFFSDLGTAHFDVVIGVTTGVHRSLIDQRRADVSSQDTIDDRIQARLKLTEAAEDTTKQARLARGVLLEKISEAVIVTDTRGNIIYTNEAARRVFLGTQSRDAFGRDAIRRSEV